MTELLCVIMSNKIIETSLPPYVRNVSVPS